MHSSTEAGMATTQEDNLLFRLYNNPELPKQDFYMAIHDLLLAGVDSVSSLTQYKTVEGRSHQRFGYAYQRANWGIASLVSLWMYLMPIKSSRATL